MVGEKAQQNLYLGLKAPLFQLFFELENDTATTLSLSDSHFVFMKGTHKKSLLAKRKEGADEN